MSAPLVADIEDLTCTVDDLMHFCTQPSASCHSASGCPQHLWVIVLTILQTDMKYNC